MHIVVVGIDHHTAPVEVREQLAFRSSELPEALAQLTVGADAPLLEAVILSTCNRVDVYGVTRDPDLPAVQATLVDFLHRFHHVQPKAYADLFDSWQDEQAVQHLFNTTCGLNSLVVGEAQIQGQVRTAHQLSVAAQASGPILHALFRHALEAGRRVRTETGIDRNAVSVSQAGVELARRVLGSLQDARILLVGSGKMSELAAKNLLDNGAQSITLVNRSIEKAQQLAQVWGGEVWSFEHLPQALCAADVVITSTSAPHTVIHVEHVLAAVAQRTTPLIMIDLAVPRDIEEAVATVAGAHVYNIDDLQEVVTTNLHRRRGELKAAEAIVEVEVERFNQWLSTRAIVPTLNDLREQAETIRQGELAKALRRLGPLDEREREIVDALTQGIVNKLLHQPTVRLKQAAAQGNGSAYASALQALFGLGTEAPA